MRTVSRHSFPYTSPSKKGNKKAGPLQSCFFCIESAIITQLSEFLQQLLASEPLQQEQLLLQQPLSWYLKNDDDGLPSF